MAYTLLCMATKDSIMNRALAAEIKAERTARGWDIPTLARASGLSLGTANRISSKNDLRDINVTQIAQIAAAFGMEAAALINRAEARAIVIQSSMSDDDGSLDDLATRRRQRAAAEMSLAEIEALEHVATRDPELDEDEPDQP